MNPPRLSRFSEAPAPKDSAWRCAGREPEKPSSSDRAMPSARKKPPKKSNNESAPTRKISGDENVAACAAADLLVLTVPFEGHAALLKQLKPAIRPGSIVIDATVPLAASVGGRATRTLGVWQGSAAQQTAELVPKGVSVVAAFQNVSAELLNGDDPVDCDVIVCSDDAKPAKSCASWPQKFPAFAPSTAANWKMRASWSKSPRC